MTVKDHSFQQCSLTSADNIQRRAIAAYFRSGGIDQPDASMSGPCAVPAHGGERSLAYVRLANTNGTLAVYRVTNRGELKRLRRWPTALCA